MPADKYHVQISQIFGNFSVINVLIKVQYSLSYAEEQPQTEKGKVMLFLY
jgi:hypothetical protein